MKLTAKNVKTLPLVTGKSETIIFDDDLAGFGLRVREGGSRSLIYQYKLGAKQRRVTLGAVSALDFGKARDAAETLYAKVKLGGDPAGTKTEAKAKAAHTFKVAADNFLAIKQRELRSCRDVERHLFTDSKMLHEMQVASVKRADIAAVLAAVRKNSGGVTGNRVRATLQTFFGWCNGEGLVESNPVIGTNRVEENARDRVLSPAELRLVWNALEADQYGAVVKLLALTGQRAGEVAGMRWSETDLDRELWELPGERTKNGRPHIVPLSKAALDIIAAQPRRAARDGKLRDLIFGVGDGPFSGWSRRKEALDQATLLPPWRVHDLRRSVATHMGESQPKGLAIQPHIIEAVLNHVSGHKAGVAGVYNRAAYEPEKRAALDRWAHHLLAWVEGREPNIKPLRAA